MYRKHIEKNLKDTKRFDMFFSSICWHLLFFFHIEKKMQFVCAAFFAVLLFRSNLRPSSPAWGAVGAAGYRLSVRRRTYAGQRDIIRTNSVKTWGGKKNENSRMRTCPRQHTYTSPHLQSWPGRLHWGPRPGGSRWSLCWSLAHPSASSWLPLTLSDWSGRRHWSQTGQKNQDRSR